MLISAADDSQVAIWDIRNYHLLISVYEPSLSLTSLTLHPLRPFSIISSHFDSSLLFWNLLSIPDVALVQLKFLLNLGRGDILCDP